MIKLFVYGTLRSQGGSVPADTQNHEFIADEILSSRPAKLENADMRSYIHYPGIEPGEGTIVGELLELTSVGLEICDGIESHPDFFHRTEVSVVAGSGDVEQAWVYWSPETMRLSGEPVPSGDWFDRDRSRHDGRSLDEALAEDRCKF